MEPTKRRRWSEIHRDRPKERRYFSVTTPNWGDPSRGYHDVVLSVLRYPRSPHAPRFAAIDVSLLAVEADGTLDLSFSIDIPVDTRQSDHVVEQELFELANLLQENVGAFGVQPSAMTREHFLRTIHVDWQVLPAGERDQVLQIIVSSGPQAILPNVAEERLDVLASLGVRDWIVGTEGFQRYFGARLDEDIVVFENMRWGNAIYVMGGNWQQTSRRSRTELLNDSSADFTRIVHSATWPDLLRRDIERRRHDRAA